MFLPSPVLPPLLNLVAACVPRCDSLPQPVNSRRLAVIVGASVGEWNTHPCVTPIYLLFLHPLDSCLVSVYARAFLMSCTACGTRDRWLALCSSHRANHVIFQ